MYAAKRMVGRLTLLATMAGVMSQAQSASAEDEASITQDERMGWWREARFWLLSRMQRKESCPYGFPVKRRMPTTL